MPPTGPQPPVAVPRLSTARRRVLEAIRALGGREVTIDELAEHLGGHPNASRAHLAALTEQGLLGVGEIRRSGAGRPPRGYSLTAVGRQALTPSQQSAGLEELASVLTDYLVNSGHGVDEARRIGEAWGAGRTEESADEDPEDAMLQVSRILDTLGFEPTLETAEDGEFVLLRRCPLLGLAKENPEFICQVHRGLVDGILQKAGAGRSIDLLPFGHPEGCVVRLRAAEEASA